jgi:hypothetical protein
MASFPGGQPHQTGADTPPHTTPIPVRQRSIYVSYPNTPTGKTQPPGSSDRTAAHRSPAHPPSGPAKKWPGGIGGLGGWRTASRSSGSQDGNAWPTSS